MHCGGGNVCRAHPDFSKCGRKFRPDRDPAGGNGKPGAPEHERRVPRVDGTCCGIGYSIYGRVRRGSDGHAKYDSDGYAEYDSDNYAKRDSDSHAKRDSDSHAEYDSDSYAKRDSDSYAKRDSDGHAGRDSGTVRHAGGRNLFG